ncbi:hypothetical protein QQS21_011033 [Conoideocrella luteorostrata]|uniref:L-tryptophan decarboxylase PsiD-like domain-containing protein n=1 Tax=Conoideocrella luteorostrata TaxID=1105319 RepID=A0AAJ0FNS7_9HYPO|nr:hypothetical protein QQS21_011033 [Conoideocrella luteorostrata]
MRDEFVRHIISRAGSSSTLQSPALRRFQRFIENNPRIFMHFAQMFDEAPHEQSSRTDPGRGGRINDYKQMLAVLDYIVRHGPGWSSGAATVGLVGLPMFAVMDYVLSTASYGVQSPASTHVLGFDHEGWFGPEAIKALTDCANIPRKSNFKFDEFYVCDSSAMHYGFKSWDDFFTRKIHEDTRPVASPRDDDVIVHACESSAYNIESNVKLRDNFFIKGQPYSLRDMLGNDPLAHYFARGTVYQAFLSALSYHRWHAPVSGVVRRAFVQDGTYFSLPLWLGPAKEGETADRMVPSQGYLSAMAARGIIIVEADNKDIGLVAFVAVGMSEVSTCEITVREGQWIEKGTGIGMFHFGGSSYCLLFRHGLQLDGLPDVAKKENCAVRDRFATVRQP